MLGPLSNYRLITVRLWSLPVYKEGRVPFSNFKTPYELLGVPSILKDICLQHTDWALVYSFWVEVVYVQNCAIAATCHFKM